jgi:hypothetical protein
VEGEVVVGYSYRSTLAASVMIVVLAATAAVAAERQALVMTAL